MVEAKTIQIEVVYATNALQQVIHVTLPEGSVIKDAIGRSELFSQKVPANLSVGVFGQLRSLESVLENGDRVEIYSPLLLDPMQARHQQVERELKAKRQAKQARETKRKQEIREKRKE